MNHSLRLLLVADVSAERVLGGAERMLVEHLRALVAGGYGVTLLTRQPQPDSPLCITLDGGVEEHRLPFDGDRGVAGLVQLRQQAKRWWQQHGIQFDLVVAEQPLVMSALHAAGCKLPRLQVCHSLACEEYATRHGLDWGLKARAAAAAMRQLEGGLYRSANRVMALSCFTRERLRRVVGVAPERIAVAPGGVSLPAVADSVQRTAWRQQLGWQGQVVMTLRNLVPRTGVDLLVQSAAILRYTHPDLRWCVVGDGELGEPLRDLCRLLQVDDRIEWCGYLAEDEVTQRMQAADLFMLPTRALEGFGLVTVEAASHGLPVVATPVDANIEVVPSIDANRLATAATPQALAQATAALLADIPDDLTPYRAKIRQQVIGLYGWKRHDEALLTMTSGLLQ